MNGNEKSWKKYVNNKILYVGQKIWINSFGNSNRAQEYVSKRRHPINDKYVNCGVGAMVGMMVRGSFLTVRSTSMQWKYDDERCVCGDVVSEENVLFDCIFLCIWEEDGRKRWMLRMLMCMIL